MLRIVRKLHCGPHLLPKTSPLSRLAVIIGYLRQELGESLNKGVILVLVEEESHILCCDLRRGLGPRWRFYANWGASRAFHDLAVRSVGRRYYSPGAEAPDFFH